MNTESLSVYLIAVLMTLSSTPRGEAHDRGLSAFRKSEFTRAAKEFAAELSLLSPSERGSPLERTARELQMFALYEAGQKDEAVVAYRQLCERFADYRFDEDAVLPETIAYLSERVPRDASGRPTTTAKADVSVASAPAGPNKFRWYYLAPLGIGQFLAGSPVRGSIFAAAEVGLIAANIATFVAFQSQVDSNRSAINPTSAAGWQTAANVTFFAAIGALVLGAIDGLFFEPWLFDKPAEKAP